MSSHMSAYAFSLAWETPRCTAVLSLTDIAVFPHRGCHGPFCLLVYCSFHPCQPQQMTPPLRGGPRGRAVLPSPPASYPLVAVPLHPLPHPRGEARSFLRVTSMWLARPHLPVPGLCRVSPNLKIKVISFFFFK